MANVTPIRTAAETALIAAYGALDRSLPGGRQAAELRAASFKRFEAQGLPHRRVEEWKYSDLRAAMREAKPLAGDPDIAALDVAARLVGQATSGLAGTPVVVVDGAFIGALSGVMPNGVTVSSLADALGQGRKDVLDALAEVTNTNTNAAIAMNGAFLRDGLVIDVAAGTEVEHEIHLVSVATGPHLVMSRHLIFAGAGSKVGILETHVGPSGVEYQKNTAMQVVVGDGATVEHGRRQIEGDMALHVASLIATIGARAHFDTLTLTTGAAFSRNQLFIRFAGEHSHASLRGVSMLKGRQHADTTLVMDHAVPNCESRETFKHILDGEAHGVFQGKIIVAPVAQKTDGRMMSQTIMLADGPAMDNKPELEIFADDVACAHGCTCGELDDELMFYLKARGIPHTEAEALLVEAFAREAIEDFGDGAMKAVEELREAMLGTVTEWMLVRR